MTTKMFRACFHIVLYSFKSNIGVVLFTVTGCIFLFTILNYIHPKTHFEHKISDLDQNEDVEDALPSAEELKPPPRSILFHETIKRGLTSRQACAVESAARLHPTREIYVLFNSPIPDPLQSISLEVLSRFINVKFARLDTVNYGTDMVTDDKLVVKNNSIRNWQIQNRADTLKFMYKYGGIYLDTDVIVVKSLDGLGKNWAGRQDGVLVNDAAMAFDTDDVGRNLLNIFLKKLKKQLKSDELDYSGPKTLTRSLKKFCSISEVLDMSAATCQGFQIYNSTTFYPIHYDRTDVLFKKGAWKDFLAFLARHNVYAVHTWGTLTKNHRVERNSPFDILARMYCPSVRWTYGDHFGVEEIVDIDEAERFNEGFARKTDGRSGRKVLEWKPHTGYHSAGLVPTSSNTIPT